MLKRYALAAGALLAAPFALMAQTEGISFAQPRAFTAASLVDGIGAAPARNAASSSSEDLPDAPSADRTSMPPITGALLDQSTHAGASGTAVAPRYATTILPGQAAVPLHGIEKAIYGVHESFSPYQFIGEAFSAGWSHIIDSAPHYGTNSGAFGERMGAAVIRGTIQNISTDAVFSPMFHDDPRYYAMGNTHTFGQRATYAATRVLTVRSSHSMDQRFNAPLILGYLVSAAANNAYYPRKDRGASETFTGFGTSLVGAALGFEVNEFLDDALKAVHLRKQ